MPAGQHHADSPRPLGRADDRAQVLRVLHTVQRDDSPTSGLCRRSGFGSQKLLEGQLGHAPREQANPLGVGSRPGACGPGACELVNRRNHLERQPDAQGQLPEFREVAPRRIFDHQPMQRSAPRAKRLADAVDAKELFQTPGLLGRPCLLELSRRTHTLPGQCRERVDAPTASQPMLARSESKASRN